MLYKLKDKKLLFILISLLLIVSLTIGFSAFQKELYVSDTGLNIRLHTETRISDSIVQKTSGAVVNETDYNRTKIFSNVTFNSISDYVLYKVNLANYGNVKSGLLDIEGDTG